MLVSECQEAEGREHSVEVMVKENKNLIQVVMILMIQNMRKVGELMEGIEGSIGMEVMKRRGRTCTINVNDSQKTVISTMMSLKMKMIMMQNKMVRSQSSWSNASSVPNLSSIMQLVIVVMPIAAGTASSAKK